ncbi:MAG: hypothetical protein KGV56_01820 [Gammaproteobacteria bacterium]|nr:hypothetical protein [Gammaproteobacteria bacterium]
MQNKQRPIAIVSKHHYFLRLKYFLLGYRVSVRPVGKNPYRENLKRKAQQRKAVGCVSDSVTHRPAINVGV